MEPETLSAGTALSPPDPSLVEQALRQGDVEAQRPVPGFFDYFFDLGEWLAEVILRALADLFGAVGGALPAGFFMGIFFFLLAAGGLLLLFVLVRLWQSRIPPAAPAAQLLPPSAPPTSPDGMDWEAELEARLARGEVHAALEALWWWLAHKLGSSRADGTFTTRELVLAAGRRDLLRAVGPLDRLLYADVVAAEGDVRRVHQTIRAALYPGGERGDAR